MIAIRNARSDAQFNQTIIGTEASNLEPKIDEIKRVSGKIVVLESSRDGSTMGIDPERAQILSFTATVLTLKLEENAGFELRQLLHLSDEDGARSLQSRSFRNT